MHIYNSRENKTYHLDKVGAVFSYKGRPLNRVPHHSAELFLDCTFNDEGGCQLDQCRKDCRGMNVTIEGLTIDTEARILACTYCHDCKCFDLVDLAEFNHPIQYRPLDEALQRMAKYFNGNKCQPR